MSWRFCFGFPAQGSCDQESESEWGVRLLKGTSRVGCTDAWRMQGFGTATLSGEEIRKAPSMDSAP